MIILWISYLLHDLHVTINLPMIIFCDNMSSTHMAKNPIVHARTKHIEVDYHFVHDLVTNGSFLVQFVRSNHQLVDIFTKGLPLLSFLCHRSKLLIVSTNSLWEDFRKTINHRHDWCHYWLGTIIAMIRLNFKFKII